MSSSTTLSIITSRRMMVAGRPCDAGSRVEVDAAAAYELVVLNRWGRFEREADEDIASKAAKVELARVMRETNTMRPPAHDASWIHSGRF
jgi:hypothetical protein